MKNKFCIVCKYNGRLSSGNFTEVIFGEQGDNEIELCYSHSVDFFKAGQMNFISKHADAFDGKFLTFKPARTKNHKLQYFM